MKRYGNLIEQVADMDNIRYAAYLACRGKHAKPQVQALLWREDETMLWEIREQLLRGAVEVGDYHSFKVYEPKERLIFASALRERIIHHALMRVCAPIFEQFQVTDS
jgi:hypothetical protein